MVVRRLALFVLLMAGQSAWAAAVARVDRSEIDPNETFNLSISVDRVRGEAPDLTPLQDDFDVLGSSTTASTNVRNGRIEQTRTFIYTLMPKRTGEIIIPKLSVDGEQTQSLMVKVTELPEPSADGEDIFVTAELDRDKTWVQAQVILKLRIYAAVAPRQPQLQEPSVAGPEVVVQKLGDDARFDSVVDGRSYDVIERRYALYPQQSGVVNIGEAVYSARIWEQSRLSSRKVFRSEPLLLTVDPIPPPPPGFPDAAWLPAESVEIVQRWNPEDTSVSAGEPLTRELQVAVSGLLANQVPPLPELDVDGLRVYPDQPELETVRVGSGIVGFRTERYALIAGQGGELNLPAVELPWWDVNAGQWAFAKIPGVSLTVAGVVTPAGVRPAPEAPFATDPSSADQQSINPFWRAASAVLALLWLLTAAGWWRSYRGRNHSSERAAPETPRYVKSRRALKAARRAALAGDLPALQQALLHWGAGKFSPTPASLTELANHLPPMAADQARGIDAALYSRTQNTEVDLRALASDLTKWDKPGAPGAAKSASELSPLAP